MDNTYSENRIKEIGICKVNAAKIWEIIVMWNMNFINWVFIARELSVEADRKMFESLTVTSHVQNAILK